MTVTLHLGDCREVMAGMEEASVDAIVCDPPYGLSFMGKAWDYDVPQAPLWREALRVLKPGGHLVAFFGTRTYHRGVVAIEDAGFEIRDQLAWVYGQGFPKSKNLDGAWQGWGTALKPALEPIVLARKPLAGTVAETVLAHGTGALNIDGCRIEGHVPTTTRGGHPEQHRVNDSDPNAKNLGRLRPMGIVEGNPLGRWPANFLHDGSDEVTAGLGEAARFFYCAKASKADRGKGNGHPTVKPTDLMRWLVRLVTPPGGTVLDPFMGSGSTGKAARLEGFAFVGIEMNPEYHAIAAARIEAANPPAPATPQMSLFEVA